MSGIYCIQNLLTNELYIGKSVDIERRWKQHKEAMKTKRYQLYSSMRAYGLDNFSFFVLEECNVNDLDKREKYWIQRKQEEGYYLYNILGVYEKEKHLKARRNKAINKRKRPKF